MSRIGTRIAIVGAAATGLFTAFLALSPTATAEPLAPAPTLPGAPTTPGIESVVQQLVAGPLGSLPGMLQNAASALTGGAQGATAPLAPASTVPPGNLPGFAPSTGPGVPQTGPLPATTPPNPLALPGSVVSALTGLPGPGVAAPAPAAPAPAPAPAPQLPNLAALSPLAALP